MFPIMISISKIHSSEVPYFFSLRNIQLISLERSCSIHHKKEIKLRRERSDMQSDVLPLRSHFTSMQLRVWTDGPEQDGMMLLQDRPLCCPPRPQVTEQWVHSDQGDQPSSLPLYTYTHIHCWYTFFHLTHIFITKS